MIQILGIKNCNTMKKTFTWLEENKFEYDFRDVKKDPLSKEELDSLSTRVGLDVLINKKGMKWRTLGLSKMNLRDDQLFEKLLEHQTMIKRPVVIAGDAVMVGFDETALNDFLKENEP